MPQSYAHIILFRLQKQHRFIFPYSIREEMVIVQIYVVAWSCITCQPKDVFSLVHTVFLKAKNNYQQLKLANSSTFPIVSVPHLPTVQRVVVLGLQFFFLTFLIFSSEFFHLVLFFVFVFVFEGWGHNDNHAHVLQYQGSMLNA